MAQQHAAAKRASRTKGLQQTGKKPARKRGTKNHVLIKFIVRLGDVNFSGGPLFHRWLPRGIQDCIETEVKVGHLQLWFERRGHTHAGMVQFTFERHEVDDTIVAKQGRLDAGPLFGMVKLENVASSLMNVLRRDLTGNAEYVTLGKNVIQSLYPMIERLLKHLRFQYGQHWLKPPDAWDSRSRSLGAVCDDWNMNWSEDNGKTWHRFKPNKSVRNYGALERTNFSEYMTQSDWAALKASVEKGRDPTLSAELVTNSHYLAAQLELRNAVVEACSALEVAISEAVRAPIKASQVLTNTVASFLKDAPLKTRLVVVASLVGVSKSSLFEDALAAVDLRNKVVHDGFIPDIRDLKLVRAVLDLSAKIISGPRIKSPVQSGNNFLAEPDVWQRSGGHNPIVVGGVSIADA